MSAMRHTTPQQLATPPRPTVQPGLMAYGLASATAVLTAAPSFYEPLWPLTWVALLPLLLALRQASARRTFLWDGGRKPSCTG